LYVTTNKDKFERYLYHNATTFSSKCETVALQVAYAWVAKLFSKWGTSANKKKLKSFCDLNWQL